MALDTQQLLATIVLVSLFFFGKVVEGHLCVYNPPQRGALNITTFGNPTCFKYKGPCGGLPSGPVQAMYQRGKTYSIQLQQNLNHYSVGHPGFLDVAIAQAESDEFQVLSVLTDYFPVRQWTRTNMSIPIDLPSSGPVGRHVLRVRYHPNKPTEPVFHECIDVMLTSDQSIRQESVSSRNDIAITSLMDHVKVNKNIKYMMDLVKGSGASEMVFALVSTNKDLNLVGVDVVTGQVVPVMTLSNFVPTDGQLFKTSDSDSVKGRVVNSVTASDSVGKRLFFLVNTDTNLKQLETLNSAADTILVYEHNKQSVSFLKFNTKSIPFNKTTTIETLYISSMNYVGGSVNSLIVTALISPDANKPNDIYLSIFSLPLTESESNIIQPKLLAVSASPLESYVDFLWASQDSSTNLVNFALLRHEDEPVTMPQRLYSVSLADALSSGKVATIQFSQLDSTQYVFSSVHTYSGSVMAFSPGNALSSLPVDGTNTWNLVSIDSKSGNLTLINELNDYQNYLGGGVVSSLSNTGRGMYTVMISADGKSNVLCRCAVKAIPIGIISEIATIPSQTKVYNWVRMDI